MCGCFSYFRETFQYIQFLGQSLFFNLCYWTTFGSYYHFRKYFYILRRSSIDAIIINCELLNGCFSCFRGLCQQVQDFTLNLSFKVLFFVVFFRMVHNEKIIRRSSVKLLVSEVLKLAKLILLVIITNAVSERSGSTLCRVKTYLRSSMPEEPLSSCLIVATYKKQVDKLKLVETASQFCFKNGHRFSIKEYILSQKVCRK